MVGCHLKLRLRASALWLFPLTTSESLIMDLIMDPFTDVTAEVPQYCLPKSITDYRMELCKRGSFALT